MTFRNSIKRRIPPSASLIFGAVLLLLGGHAFAQHACNDAPPTGARHFSELSDHLRSCKPDINLFRAHGPFRVDIYEEFEIPVSTERSTSDLALSGIPEKAPLSPGAVDTFESHIDSDMFLSGHVEQAPLVIFMHGYMGSRQTHYDQAMHVASWGMHALTLRLPNAAEWGSNGRTLARVVSFLSRPSGPLEGRVDPRRVILVGYSFGGTSVAVALALGARVTGAILLDPAATGRSMPDLLPRISVPVLVIGADERVAQTENRNYYYQNMRGPALEVSVRGASHEDAQSAAEAGLTTPELQRTFLSTLTAGAFSLSISGTLDYAWKAFDGALMDGRLFGAKKRE